MRYLLFALSIFLSRIIPHAPGITPIYALTLCMGLLPNKALGALSLLAAFIASDLVCGLVGHYSAFGDWTFFVYSGFIVMLFFGQALFTRPSLSKTTLLGLSACTTFWLWSNFGTWLTSGIYSHTTNGFLLCYWAALPFLLTTVLVTCLCVFMLVKVETLLISLKLI